MPNPNPAPAVTTIKVPRPLRQRIAADAAEQGVTAAVFLTGLIERYERDRRLTAVRHAYENGVDDDYTELTRSWDRLSGEDVDRG